MDDPDALTVTFEIIEYLHNSKPHYGRLLKGTLATTVALGQIIYQGGETCGGPTDRSMLGHPG